MLRFPTLALLAAISLCGANPELRAGPVEPNDVPEVVTLSGVDGCAEWRDCLGKPVIRLPDGALRVGAGRGHVGMVMRWIAPGTVEVERPVK